MTPVELVKQHPVATGIGALVVFGAVLLFINNGGETEDGSAVLPAYAPSYADNSAYQVAQLAAATKMAEIDAARELGIATLATQQTIAGYERDVAFNANEIAGNVQITDITEANATQRLVSTLQANVAIKQADSELSAYLAQQGTIREQQSYAYQSMLRGYETQQSIANSNASIAQSQAQYAAQIAQSQIGASLESQRIAKQPSGLLSFLFG